VTDYKKNTGNTATMMIRDNNPTVEFWINANSGSTFNHELPWGYTVNGVTNNDRQTDYSAGDNWKKLGSWNVTSDQTVVFRLFDTNTSGFGGPTTLSVSVDRASAPSKPSKPTISEITSTGMRVRWTAGASNGDAIDTKQLARNTTNTTSGANISSSDGDTNVTGLTAGVTYYFWARTHNSKGYSPWSEVASARTLSVGSAPDQVITSDPTQTGFTLSFTDNNNGGSPILERQIAYNTTNTTTGATAVSYSGVMTLTGLEPATTYYVWARVRNSVGWSPYSPVAIRRTIAGTWFNVGNEWKEAVPYVRDGGVWKIARPWSRDAGVWKETT
jgi:fibronectin type III domain protein